MPTGLKVVVAFNIVLTILIGVVFWSVAYAPAPFPPDLRNSLELTLVPIRVALREPSEVDPKKATAVAERIEIPPEYRTPDPNPSPWVIQPDGTVRFTESDRRSHRLHQRIRPSQLSRHHRPRPQPSRRDR
jgi:hypothetical protein